MICDVCYLFIVFSKHIINFNHILALKALTNFMFTRVVGDLYGIQFEAVLRLSYVIDPCDVGAHLINHLH